MKKIEEYFAFVAPGPDGNEAVLGLQAQTQQGVMQIPIAAHTMEQMEQFRPVAKHFADAFKTPVTLVKFTGRMDIETVS